MPSWKPVLTLSTLLCLTLTPHALTQESKTIEFELEPSETGAFDPSSPQPTSVRAYAANYPHLKLNAELGFLGVLDHKIQFSNNTTQFDYVRQGAQDTLFDAAKLSVDLHLDPHHSFTFMYQPLSLNTSRVIDNDISIDNVAFAAGTPMRFRYDFPFFRGSYLYDFDPDFRNELAAGISLQLRNARIEFASLDGEKLVSNRDVGPVPILKFRSRHMIGDSPWWWGSEIDGFYAPISILNGSTNEVIGAFLDANIRGGVTLENALNTGRTVSPYLNIRYLGGGSVGTSRNPEAQGDGFTDNWLHFLVVSLGVQTDLF